MRPLSFARYIAASASRISSSALVVLAGGEAGDGDPDRGVDEVVDPLHRERLGEGGGDPLGDRDRLAVVGETVDQDPELVAAEAGDDVAGAQVGAQPRRDGAQQGVAGVVAEAVVDELEVVEVEEEDPDRRAGDRGAAERVVDRVDEAEPVGQAGEGVVEDAVAERPVGGVALEGVGEDVGRGFEEGDVLGIEARGSAEWTSSTPKGRSLPSITTASELVAPRARTAGGILKRSSSFQSATMIGTPASSAAPACDSRPAETRRPEASALVVEARPQVEPAAVAPDLPDAGELDSVQFADQGDRVAHQRLGVAVFQRPFAEPRDHRLLGERALQVDLGGLALADVVEDAVPDRDAVRSRARAPPRRASRRSAPPS